MDENQNPEIDTTDDADVKASDDAAARDDADGEEDVEGHQVFRVQPPRDLDVER